MAHDLQSDQYAAPRTAAATGSLDMTGITTITLLAAAVLLTGQPPAAIARSGATTTEDYRVRYDARRDVYCVRFFADPPAADPHPGPSIDTCQSRDAWAREDVRIDRLPPSEPS
ncbi:hypothetical protein GCM10008023_34720 [Sphingomonas glacialis]|uniref:UrcA family protein n=2 Tax=Sphingomonas glacialis TaxID=658225 RepID=A0ABQ3LQR0_9SPHN|nr:hypothetical protein GCM10008023_34720 [Sphingomonas glacialis]